MQNELTAERIAAAIRVVETEQKCVMRNADGYCDRQCEKCDLLMLVAEILGGYDTALGALREQAERNKGCEYCLQGEDLAYGLDSMQRTGRIYIDGNLLTADLYSESMAVAVRFCPMCGRRLEVEPWLSRSR